MKSILLATQGPEPGQEALDYALSLARRLSARLLVLQVVPPVKTGLARLVSGLAQGTRRFGDTMAAAAFAEAGEPAMARRIYEVLAAAEKKNRQDDPLETEELAMAVEIRQGPWDQVVGRFIDENKDVVLAICGHEQDRGQAPSWRPSFARKTGVPLVSITHAPS